MSAAAQLVSKCLAVRTAAHKSHLTTRSYARHVAGGVNAPRMGSKKGRAG